MNKKHGIIKFKGIDFHYYVEGHRGGRNLVVYKIKKEDNLGGILEMKRIVQNFATWAFEAEYEASKIIKKDFKLLNK